VGYHTQMARVPLDRVRGLPVSAVCDLWAEETRRPRALFSRELRLGLANLPRLRAGLDKLDPLTPDNELPGEDAVVDRDWLREFCAKQHWALPQFWFPRDEIVRRPGRPSIRNLVLEKFEQRHKAGRTERQIAAEARAIHIELVEELPGERIPESETIEGHIREAFNRKP
jgi:hypothetical protein